MTTVKRIFQLTDNVNYKFDSWRRLLDEQRQIFFAVENEADKFGGSCGALKIDTTLNWGLVSLHRRADKQGGKERENVRLQKRDEKFKQVKANAAQNAGGHDAVPNRASSCHENKS